MDARRLVLAGRPVLALWEDTTVTIVPRQMMVRVTGPDGVTWEGEGEGLAAAMRDLGRRHRRRQRAALRGETRWRLTAKGEAAVARLRQREQEGG